jgi:hypothetical protein
MVAARRNRFSSVLENLFQPVGPVILSGHDRKRRKDFTDCAQGSLHSLEPLWEQKLTKNPLYVDGCRRSHPGTDKWHDDCCNSRQPDQ